MKSLHIYLPLAVLISITNAFYVPGIAPHEFFKGSRIGEMILMMLAK